MPGVLVVPAMRALTLALTRRGVVLVGLVMMLSHPRHRIWPPGPNGVPWPNGPSALERGIHELSTRQLMNLTFSRRTDLALAALQALALSPDKMSGALLASEIGTTTSFLSHVMSPLVRAGWVTSERGPGGGYHLTSTAEGARLLDVVEATEGATGNGRCVLQDGPCPGTSECAVHTIWQEARRVLVDGFVEVPAFSPPSKGADE